MKKVLITATCLLLVGFIALATTQIPDFKNQPMLVKADGSLSKLEKQSAEMKSKAKGMGYGGISTFLNLIGTSSPVSINANDAKFIMKVEDEVDPETLFYLTPCAVKGKGREVEMARASAFAGYGAKGKSTRKDDIQLEFSKVEKNVYTISIASATPLVSGKQYAFVSSAQGTSGSATVVFLFGVN
jgi:hypothetical protein